MKAVDIAAGPKSVKPIIVSNISLSVKNKNGTLRERVRPAARGSMKGFVEAGVRPT
jgi:hypothetical protein